MVARLGQKPEKLPTVEYKSAPKEKAAAAPKERPRQKKDMVGVDVFLDWLGGTADAVGEKLKALAGDELELVMI